MALSTTPHDIYWAGRRLEKIFSTEGKHFNNGRLKNAFGSFKEEQSLLLKIS